ncbi:MAG TPA: nucleotide exchange factor GrpE [Gemmatimonadaceae bacterium]
MAERNDGGPDEVPTPTAADVPVGEAGSAQGAPAAAGDAEELKRQLAEQQDKYLRLAAEFDNFRRRTAKERLEAGARGQAELVRQLIDPLDDLARFAHVDPASTDAATVVQGAAMVESKLLKVLGNAGLTVLSPVGEPFDPNLHEAMTTTPAASAAEDHTVAQVFQVGYLFNGMLLRPARVVVKQWNG